MNETTNSRYGSLLFLDGREEAASPLARLPFAGDGSQYDEGHIRDLVFAHPEILPVVEIDPNYGRLIPVCRELRTPAGPIDAVFVNERGLLTLVECKLWRNPQARREVIGQILDYAKELGRWQYEDVQREVSRALKRPGNSLYEIVQKGHPGVVEDVFVDAVARCLRTGRFLLLIVGDGIREGVEYMVTFLQEHAGLHFTFGLVEVALFEAPNGGRIVQPRVLARTILLERIVVRTLDAQTTTVAEVEADDSPALQAPEELNDALRQDVEFWNSVAAGLRLDDVLQPPPRRGGRGWIKLPLPLGCHITGYRARLGIIGVFLSLKNAKGITLWNMLHADQEAISRELPPNTEWTSYPEGGGCITVLRNYKDVLEPSVAEEQKEWIRENLNCFVNVFRHRIATAAAEGIAGRPI